MKRKLTLPAGWVAQNADEMSFFIEDWGRKKPLNPAESSFLMLPHAGWYYSGHFAWDLFYSLKYQPDLVLILGGHLSSRDPLLLWDFDSCESTLGDIPIHRALTDKIAASIPTVVDNFTDNSVEVFLPFLAHFWPGIPLVAMRIPPDPDSLKEASFIYNLVQQFSSRPLIIASSDLTHYGSHYRFFPDLEGMNAREWVEKNDARIIQSAAEGRGEDVIDTALRHSNACSAGAIAWMVHCASLADQKVRLIEYGSSLDKGRSDSFVGYASMASSASS